MMSINFNKDDYIKNYRLTLREFHLMGPDLQLTYAHRLCKDIVEKIPNIGDEHNTTDYIPTSRFATYFRANGCLVSIIDHGAFGLTTNIKRVSKDTYKPSESSEELLEEYRLKVGTAKAEIIEELLTEYFSTLTSELATDKRMNLNLTTVEEILTTFESEILSTIYLGDEFPTREEGERIISAYDKGNIKLSKVELSNEQIAKFIGAELAQGIYHLELGEDVILSGSDSMLMEYCDYLRSLNYQVIETEEKAVVRKIV
ncbi:MAG: hypothetical protein J1F35_02085 [Erysipelotrichales bacterium]|nr:hypothetical protein [Erysipelotrichales bacterium]